MSLGLISELGVDIVAQSCNSVGETESMAGKDHRRPVLRRQIEVVPAQPELLQQFRERTDSCSRRSVVRHRMQADIVIATT